MTIMRRKVSQRLGVAGFPVTSLNTQSVVISRIFFKKRGLEDTEMVRITDINDTTVAAAQKIRT